MEKKIEKGSEEWMFQVDYWKLRQKYYEAESDDWFEILIVETDRLYRKYKDTIFGEYAKRMLLEHSADVDRRWRKK